MMLKGLLLLALACASAHGQAGFPPGNQAPPPAPGPRRNPPALPPRLNQPPNLLPAFQPPLPPFLPKTPQCPRKPCLNNLLCPFGVLLDKLGCPTCICRPAPMCPPPRCMAKCPFGVIYNKFGCPTCFCRTPFFRKPMCPTPNCAPGCKLVPGLTGCPVCDCFKGPGSPRGPRRGPDDN